MNLIGQAVHVVGWMVSRKGVLTKQGEDMEFVSFEDETAIFETVLFPKAYERSAAMLSLVQPFLLHGHVKEDMGAMYLDVQSMDGLGELDGAITIPAGRSGGNGAHYGYAH